MTSAMKSCRIHIFGASGSGVTTLGRAIAEALVIPHHDTDDYLWRPTNPPYRETRAVPDRLRLMREMFLDRADWVLSGTLSGWGEPVVPFFDLAVFVETPTDVRLARLRERETRHFGVAAVAPGGWRHQETEDFIEWSSHYEDETREGCSRARHEAFLAALACPTLRVDGCQPVDVLLRRVTACVVSHQA
jgi:adenylate kinase family enzyme